MKDIAMKTKNELFALWCLAYLYGALGLTNAKNSVMKGLDNDVLTSMPNPDGGMMLGFGGDTIVENTLRIKLIALYLNGLNGVAMLTTAQAKFSSGLKDNALSGIAFKVLSGLGIISGTKSAPVLRTTNKGNITCSPNLWLKITMPRFDELQTSVEDFAEDDLEEEDEEEEWVEESAVESVTVQEGVIDMPTPKELQALYPQTGLMLGFFSLLATTFNTAKEIINFSWVKGVNMKVQGWRNNPTALKAIENGETSYRYGNDVKDITSIEHLTKDKVNKKGETVKSNFHLVLASEIVMQSFHFVSTGKSVDVLRASMGSAWMAFVATGMRAITYACENGANEDHIGYGFIQYIDDAFIEDLLQRFCIKDDKGNITTPLKQYGAYGGSRSASRSVDWESMID